VPRFYCSMTTTGEEGPVNELSCACVCLPYPTCFFFCLLFTIYYSAY
jgi:hypothetical protein